MKLWKEKGSASSDLVNTIQEIETKIENGVYSGLGEKLTQYSRYISKELEDRLISDILEKKVE
ncbi:hypothetical protein [Paenibacillus periandrae]|uniref:hypothetical protein n=1 Tax=Paenibacillus periandrae TaxID=1761741 RepID=UPI001F08F61A|nr:hypothetical protein [Paenibacillus periandrae]